MTPLLCPCGCAQLLSGLPHQNPTSPHSLDACCSPPATVKSCHIHVMCTCRTIWQHMLRSGPGDHADHTTPHSTNTCLNMCSSSAGQSSSQEVLLSPEAILGRRVAFLLLQDFQHTDAHGRTSTLPRGVHQVRAGTLVSCLPFLGGGISHMLLLSSILSQMLATSHGDG